VIGGCILAFKGEGGGSRLCWIRLVWFVFVGIVFCIFVDFISDFFRPYFPIFSLGPVSASFLGFGFVLIFPLSRGFNFSLFC